MKKAAIVTTWRRVLPACLLCVLYCGAAAAAVVSSQTSNNIDLQKKREEALDAGGEAADAQLLFTVNILDLSITTEELLSLAKAAAAGDDEGAKKTLAEVQKVAETAGSLKTGESSVEEAMKQAHRETVKVFKEALNLTRDVPGVTVTKEKVEDWKKTADEADELWKEAAKKTKAQFLMIDRMLTEVGAARAAAGTAIDNGGAALRAEAKGKMEELGGRLGELSEYIQNAKNNAERVKDQVHTAKDKIKEAVNETVAQATAKIDNLVNAAKQETRKGSEDAKTAQPQDLSGENENLTTNDDSVKTLTGASTPNELNKDSSPDGSPLTASRLAATSVLLLLARVAAVMISA